MGFSIGGLVSGALKALAPTVSSQGVFGNILATSVLGALGPEPLSRQGIVASGSVTPTVQQATKPCQRERMQKPVDEIRKLL